MPQRPSAVPVRFGRRIFIRRQRMLGRTSICYGCIRLSPERIVPVRAFHVRVQRQQQRQQQQDTQRQLHEMSTVAAVRALPSVSWSSGDSCQPECALCLEAFAMGDKVTHLSCAHGFHTDCVNRWLIEGQRLQQRRCPLCSADPLEASSSNLLEADAVGPATGSPSGAHAPSALPRCPSGPAGAPSSSRCAAWGEAAAAPT